MTSFFRKSIHIILALAVLLVPLQHAFASAGSHDVSVTAEASDITVKMTIDAQAKADPHCDSDSDKSLNNGSCYDCEMCAHCAAPAALPIKPVTAAVAEQPVTQSLPFYSFNLSPEHRPPRRA